MAKEDRRTMYSKKMIRESLYELMKEKPLNKISVTEICKKADVNRSTFYAYYTDIYDLHQQITKDFFSLQKNVIKHIKESITAKNALDEFTYSDFYTITYYYLKTVEENTELYKFTELFGLTSTKGYLCDDDTDHCLEDYPLMITPDVNGETYTSAVSGKDVFVVIGGTQAISKTETTPNGVTITPILTTSEKAYVKEDISTGDYEFDSEKDVRKQYYAAASAINSAGGGIVWIGSSSVLFDDYDYYCGFGNKLFFMQALKDTSGFAESISIAPAMVDSGTINTTPTIVYVFLSIVTIVPLGLTVYGVIRYRRRRYA